MKKRHSPLLIILSSPSGAGKSSIAREAMAIERNLCFSVSATTRAQRPGEVDGQHYHFVSEKEFKQMIDKGDMLEYAEVFGNYYGTPIQPVLAALNDGMDVIFDVDWQGGAQIRQSKLKDFVVSVFVLPPSIKALHQRLEFRAQDEEAVIDKRMEQSASEISHWNEYDYLIVNADFSSAVEDFRSILRSERLKKDRWSEAEMYVSGLNAEFEAYWNGKTI